MITLMTHTSPQPGSTGRAGQGWAGQGSTGAGRAGQGSRCRGCQVTRLLQNTLLYPKGLPFQNLHLNVIAPLSEGGDAHFLSRLRWSLDGFTPGERSHAARHLLPVTSWKAHVQSESDDREVGAGPGGTALTPALKWESSRSAPLSPTPCGRAAGSRSSPPVGPPPPAGRAVPSTECDLYGKDRGVPVG